MSWITTKFGYLRGQQFQGLGDTKSSLGNELSCERMTAICLSVIQGERSSQQLNTQVWSSKQRYRQEIKTGKEEVCRWQWKSQEQTRFPKNAQSTKGEGLRRECCGPAQGSLVCQGSCLNLSYFSLFQKSSQKTCILRQKPPRLKSHEWQS